MTMHIEFEQEKDGRWIAEIPSLPGVMAYGNTQEEAEVNVLALARSVVQHLKWRRDLELGASK